MKKTYKRILCLLLASMMVAAIFSGCGSKPAASANPANSVDGYDPLIDNEETINLTVFSQTANWSGAQTGWGATLLKDKFNIELTIIPDTNGAYQTRMESKNLGDIVVWGSNGDEYAAAVNQGLLFDWEEEDLLDTYGKYIAENLPDGIAANKAINADGKVYGIGNGITNQRGQHDTFIYDWGIRWDLYEQLGHPEVKNLDDLADVLRQMKEICPTGDDGKPTYAVSIWPDWDGETGNFYPSLEENGPYLNALKFLNKLYQMGLVDPDSMTQTYDQMMPKMQNGNCLFSIFDYAGSNLYNTPDHIADNKYMLPLVPTEANPIVYGLSTGGNTRIWSIGNNSLYPEKCMQLLNWLYTPEGGMTTWYGIKGLMWDYDENGNIFFTELGQKCANDPSYDLTGVEWTSPDTGKTYTLDGTFNDGLIQANNTTWAYGAVNPDSNGERYHKLTWASQMGDPKNDAESDWRTVTGAEGTQSYMETTAYKVFPAAPNFSVEEKTAELQLKWDQCKECIKNGSWKAMYAASDAEFASLVEQMRKDANAYGYQDCVDWCQAQAAIRFATQEG